MLIKKTNTRWHYTDRDRILELLNELLLATHANRVWIFSLWKADWNCGYSPAGFWHCDFEIVNGLPEHAGYYQRVPTMIMPNEFEYAEKHGFVCMNDTIENLAWLHMARGAGSWYGKSLYDREGNFIGGVGCDWKEPDGFNYAAIRKIADMAIEIEDLIVLNISQPRKKEKVDWEEFESETLEGFRYEL